VVDNGSTDDTADVARRSGATVAHEARRGYGFACLSGVIEAAQADLLVFLDGDFSYLPAEIPRLLEPVLRGQADLVLGSRALGHVAPGAMPPQQRFGNWLAARLMRLLYDLPVTDLGPLRAVQRELVLSLDMRDMTYGWPTEMMVKAARLGARILEVPVGYHPRRAGRSKVSGTLRGVVLAGYHILKVTLFHVNWNLPAAALRQPDDRPA
jgi:glycosyltransferase involved in cell wall biosynthesis